MGALRSNIKIAVACVAGLVAASATHAQAPAPPANPAPHLSTSVVAQIAAAEFVKSGHSLRDFQARPPKLGVGGTKWYVYFTPRPVMSNVDGKFEALLPLDADVVVVIDDVTRRTCVQNAHGVGPCF